MTNTELVLIAFVLDLIVGDPRSLPHPVNLIARFAKRLEHWTRVLFRPFVAGIITTVLTVSIFGLATWSVIRVCSAIDSRLAILAQVYFLYSGIAAKSLIEHACAVWKPLRQGDLETARGRVGYMVGRDTACLDESGVVRATLESVGENTIDGITGPLMFAFLGGPVAVMIYKSASTLDSLFGYRDETYRAFGWASAKLDDLFNWVPARLTGPLMICIGVFPGFRFIHAWNVYWRDRLKHASPNAGHGEAAMAGLLGVRLGGPSYYRGCLNHKQTLGAALTPLTLELIPKACFVSMSATCLFILFGWLFHMLLNMI